MNNFVNELFMNMYNVIGISGLPYHLSCSNAAEFGYTMQVLVYNNVMTNMIS